MTAIIFTIIVVCLVLYVAITSYQTRNANRIRVETLIRVQPMDPDARAAAGGDGMWYRLQRANMRRGFLVDVDEPGPSIGNRLKSDNTTMSRVLYNWYSSEI